MAKNDDIIIPSSPDDQKKLHDGIKEISNSMTRVEGEKDYQKEALEALSEATGVATKHIRRMATDYHKDQFDKKVREMDEYSKLYVTIMDDGNNEVGED